MSDESGHPIAAVARKESAPAGHVEGDPVAPGGQAVRGAPAAEAQPATLPAAESLVIAAVGSGGDGVALLGDLLLHMAAHQGLYGIMVQSYGPQIRGGESAAVIRIAREEVRYEGDSTDVLLCFR